MHAGISKFIMNLSLVISYKNQFSNAKKVSLLTNTPRKTKLVRGDNKMFMEAIVNTIAMSDHAQTA